MWNSFNTYDLSEQQAFETLNNQLFDRFLQREYGERLLKFRVINGAGGDGGIEAYGLLADNTIIAVQSKWFRNNLEDSQISQINNSVRTAMQLRPHIIKYIVCIPRDINSVKFGKGKKAVSNTEESRLSKFTSELKHDFPSLEIVWWFEHEMRMEMLKDENEGIHKYWFEKEMFSFNLLKEKFTRQKTNSWLKERYVPSLNFTGVIQHEIGKQLFSKKFRENILSDLKYLMLKLSSFNLLLTKMMDNSEQRFYFQSLSELSINLRFLVEDMQKIQFCLKEGSEIKIQHFDWEEPLYESMENVELILEMEYPTNLQKPYFDQFQRNLKSFHNEILLDFFILCDKLNSAPCSLIFGRAGTGKTHGLAFGVENSLKDGLPAILIRAYGAVSSSWSSLLTTELELNDWNLNEILSALETLAYRNDVKKGTGLKPGAEQDFEYSKVLVCIDGLEEDLINADNWYDRIAEAEEITKKFSRIRFLFSARNSFYDNSRIPEGKIFSTIDLPREGDAAIADVQELYFREYDINIENMSLISGLDSLFALRLFCEEYKKCILNDNSEIETAAAKLLNLKLKRINIEFLRLIGKQNLHVDPVRDALQQISELFYFNSELDHSELKKSIDKELQEYLTKGESEFLVQFLTENGILTRNESEEGIGILKKTIKRYTITYQSILEIILTDRIVNRIMVEGETELPEIIFRNVAPPEGMNYDDFRIKYGGKRPNQQLMQNVVNKILVQTGKLVGIDGFLAKSLSEERIFAMQLEAIGSADNETAEKFKSWLDEIFLNDYHKRFKIVKQIIYPFADRPGYPFNGMYLHSFLSKFPDAFSRDKFWSGMDAHDKQESGLQKAWSLENVYSHYFDLNQSSHFGRPLIYAWGFSTLNQRLREQLRTKLTKWALSADLEFVKLLDLMKNCNDPQIMEDLAAVSLGIAGRSRDRAAILGLCRWSLEHIFNQKDIYCNVIVRQGFKAAVERAYQFRLITKKELSSARPSKVKNLSYLPLDVVFLKNSSEAHYPIVHDLAWYVIRGAYDNFLVYEIGYNKQGMSKETALFLKRYEQEQKNRFALGPHEWTMAAALCYIKKLGFNRKKGNSFTQASHGAKSELFTYEEKYVWLAVNFIKGYLSDYLPFNDLGNKFWINDYSELTEMHNPGEDINKGLEAEVDQQTGKKKWIIRETLAPEIKAEEKAIKSAIENAVDHEPAIKFTDWIHFSKTDFDFFNLSNAFSALYHSILLYNSDRSLQSSIDIRCCVMPEKDFAVFKEAISKNYNNKLLKDDLQFQTTPFTDVYANPSDIIWMDWIGQDGAEIQFTDKISFAPAIAVITKKSVSGEEQVYIPSREGCNIMGIVSLEDDLFYDRSGKAVGACHKIKGSLYGERQEILAVDDALFKTNLAKRKLIRFWFALTIINKNALNKKIKDIPHIQKVRKYLISEEGETFEATKFWDGRFSNQI